MSGADRIGEAERRLRVASGELHDALGALERAAADCYPARTAEHYDALSVAAREVADATRRCGYFRADLARIKAVEAGADA